ncbi:hypothetical protein LguiA_016078 [Lonicera macranthoides]
MDMGHGKYGCSHYRRRCKIRAPCCDEIFDCRHCHNKDKVICSMCNTEQDVQQNCIQCGVCMGSTTAPNASSLMTMCQRINSTVINVESAGLAAKKTFSIVIDAIVAMQKR